MFSGDRVCIFVFATLQCDATDNALVTCTTMFVVIGILHVTLYVVSLDSRPTGSGFDSPPAALSITARESRSLHTNTHARVPPLPVSE